jgi:hypothetical protein
VGEDVTGLLVGTAEGLRRVGSDGTELEGRDVAHVAALGSELWAIADGTELWRSTDGGLWDLVGPVGEWSGRCILPTDTGVLVGTSDAHLLLARPGGSALVEGFDHVPGRDGWYTPWGGPPDTRSMSDGPDGTLYVNVHVGGIPCSRDGGENWEPTIDVDADVHQVLAVHERSGVVLAATAYGLAVSEDGGDSWRFETDGLHAEYCRAVAVGADTLFLTASRSHRGQEAGVYRRSLDGSGPLERCRQGLPEWFDDNVDTHCLAASGDTVAVGAPGGDVFVSRDGGSTWDLAASGLPDIRCVAIEDGQE